MTRVIMFLAGAVLVVTPALAQTTGATTTTPPSTTEGNGVTTGVHSGPEMKTGSERSPTAGAPTGSTSGTATGGTSGGSPNRN